MPPAAFPKRRSDVVEIKGTANAATDTARLQAAVATANAAGVPVTFHVSGSVYLNALVTITAPVSWTFASSGELVRAAAAGGVQYGSLVSPWDSGTSYSMSWPAWSSGVAVTTGDIRKNGTRAYKASTTGTTGSTAPVHTSGSASDGSVTWAYEEMDGTTVGDHTITSPYLALAGGDYVAVWGQNEVTAPDFTPHSSNDRFIPLEIHRISRAVTGAAHRYVFADFCDDACTSEPRIRKLTMLTGIRIEAMRARALPGAYSESPAFLSFAYCADLELINCTFGPSYPGALQFFCCYDVRRTGLRLGDVENPNANLMTADGGAYGILDRVVTLGEVNDCTFGTIRHGYSTGAATRNWVAGVSVFAGERRASGLRIYQATAAGTTGSTAPSHTSGSASDGAVTWSYVTTGRYRSGTVRAFRVANCRAGLNGVQTGTTTWSGLSPYDTHSEAIRGVFEGNEARMPNDSGNIGFTIRGRNITLKNNTIYGSSQTIPVQIMSTNCTVVGNTFIGGHRCEVIDKEGTNGNPKNARFIGNRFVDFYNPGVIIFDGSDHLIADNAFVNCGYLWNNSPNIPSAAIYVENLYAGGTVTIIGNQMPRYSNKMSVLLDETIPASAVRIDNNVMTGYGDWNDGTRHKLWMPNETGLAYGDLRWANGREYRVYDDGGTTGSTAPSHTSGTAVDNQVTWQYVRDVDTSVTTTLTRQSISRNGWPKMAVYHYSGHSLTHADQYKPINDVGDVIDNTDNAYDGGVFLGFVLLEVLDDANYLVARKDELIDIPLAMFSGSFSVSVPVMLYWNNLTGKYQTSAPTNNKSGHALQAISSDTTHVQAIVQWTV